MIAVALGLPLQVTLAIAIVNQGELPTIFLPRRLPEKAFSNGEAVC